jgi:hypothetical protein
MAGVGDDIQLKFQCRLTPSKATEYPEQKALWLLIFHMARGSGNSLILKHKNIFVFFSKHSAIMVTDLLLVTLCFKLEFNNYEEVLCCAETRRLLAVFRMTAGGPLLILLRLLAKVSFSYSCVKHTYRVSHIFYTSPNKAGCWHYLVNTAYKWINTQG